jgi:hypothetical protein
MLLTLKWIPNLFWIAPLHSNSLKESQSLLHVFVEIPKVSRNPEGRFGLLWTLLFRARWITILMSGA